MSALEPKGPTRILSQWVSLKIIYSTLFRGVPYGIIISQGCEVSLKIFVQTLESRLIAGKTRRCLKF